jgi:subtilisin family serine protease
MILRKSALLSVALLILAIFILPMGTSSASVSAPQSSEAVSGSPADPSALPSEIPTDQIIVKYKIPASMAGAISPAGALEMQRLSDAAGVPLTYVREMSGDAYVLGLPSRMPLEEVQAIADRLSALPEVQYAEPDAIMLPQLTPNDPQYANQWHYFAPGAGHYGINAPAAWDLTTGSSSIVVADIDTGITNHVDLAGRTAPGYDFVTNVTSANDGNGRDSDPSDPGDWVTAAESSSGPLAGCSVTNSSWHGTHTAGTIGAASNNGVGVAGVNWNSKILPVRVLGKCGGTLSDIADGMRWSAGLSVSGVPANANPAKVLNLSLGGSGACGTTYQDAINAIVAAGTTVVVSAGNSNADASGARPANCNGVITVAATNRNGYKASYSNYGAVVEISAPGGETSVSGNGVLSTLNTGTQGPVADTYVYYQGTSMAAPHVTGVVSLMYSRKPSLTPAQVLSYLQSTVTAFPAGSTCNTSNCGSGIVNAGAAVAAVPVGIQDKKVYLPLVRKEFPAVPAAPVLNAIANADGDGNYTVSWNASANATSYLLQEDDNAAFSSPDTRYSGAGTSWDAAGKAVGTYYYRVQASNTLGTSGWSNTQSAVVQPPSSGPTPGFWQQSGGAMEFYVTSDRAFVDDFAVNVTVSGCGSYKITHLTQAPISGNSFSFTGPFYASGTFSSQTAAGGTMGLSSFPISGCGTVSGGPWVWSATWMHSAQLMRVEAAEANQVDVADPGNAYEVTRIP